MKVQAVGQAVKSVFDFFAVCLSGKEREKRYQVHRRQRRDKALNCAEQFIFLTHEIERMAPSNLKEAKKRRRSAHEKKFFHLT